MEMMSSVEMSIDKASRDLPVSFPLTSGQQTL